MMGGTVHLVCRNEQRGQEALNEIKTQTGKDMSYFFRSERKA